jgi:hypothetical protein
MSMNVRLRCSSAPWPRDKQEIIMTVVTRIGLAPILQARTGSVALPAEVTLSCPQCGALAADKGNCLVEMRRVTDEKSKTGFVARLAVDCRSCGCSDREPAVSIL